MASIVVEGAAAVLAREEGGHGVAAGAAGRWKEDSEAFHSKALEMVYWTEQPTCVLTIWVLFLFVS